MIMHRFSVYRRMQPNNSFKLDRLVTTLSLLPFTLLLERFMLGSAEFWRQALIIYREQ